MGSRATSGAALRCAMLSLLCMSITACTSQENLLLKNSNTKVEDAAFFPSDDNLRMAKVYFHNENYGLAAQSYQKAVEVTPKDAEAWLGLAAAWQVATQAGTPLSGCLHDLAASLRDLAQVQRDCEVALAAPRATARLVMVLPVIGLLFGSVMGFDTLHTLFATLPGLVCLVAGGLLMLAAASWNRALVRRAAPTELTPGLRLELMAIAMGGGGSMERARMIVQAAIERYRIGAEAGVGSGIDPIDGVLELSRRAGVPAVELLRSEAEQRRRDARSVAQGRAAALSVTLMLPLGVCVLPAFMLVGVVPLLISVLSSTLATF